MLRRASRQRFRGRASRRSPPPGRAAARLRGIGRRCAAQLPPGTAIRLAWRQALLACARARRGHARPASHRRRGSARRLHACVRRRRAARRRRGALFARRPPPAPRPPRRLGASHAPRSAGRAPRPPIASAGSLPPPPPFPGGGVIFFLDAAWWKWVVTGRGTAVSPRTRRLCLLATKCRSGLTATGLARVGSLPARRGRRARVRQGCRGRMSRVRSSRCVLLWLSA